MSSLSKQQKELIFEYFFGLTSQKAAAEELISSNSEAAELYTQLKASLGPLESLEVEPCPDDLAQSTIYRANNLARSSQLRLKQLLRDEQAKVATAGRSFWLNFGELAAIAAIILIFAGFFPVLRAARQKAWQAGCQAQLARVWQGTSQYAADHDGRLPMVATTAGSPWWKVGYQGNENHSNTRHLWLLVKGGYVKPADFVCPGRRQGRAVSLNRSNVKNYNDFPCRKYVTYSFRIVSTNDKKRLAAGRKILVADLNPIFEKLPADYSQAFYRQLNKELLTTNSKNHNRKGQNIMFTDGSVVFVNRRNIGVSADDIFTLRDKDAYHGFEVPECEADTFLAP